MFRTLHLIAASAILLSAAPAEAAVRSYFAPEWNGTRVDACLSTGTDCGKPAADAFCRVQGYDGALLFQRETFATTRTLGSEQVCTGTSCTAFRQIKCITSKGDFAGLEQPAE